MQTSAGPARHSFFSSNPCLILQARTAGTNSTTSPNPTATTRRPDYKAGTTTSPPSTSSQSQFQFPTLAQYRVHWSWPVIFLTALMSLVLSLLSLLLLRPCMNLWRVVGERFNSGVREYYEERKISTTKGEYEMPMIPRRRPDNGRSPGSVLKSTDGRMWPEMPKASLAPDPLNYLTLIFELALVSTCIVLASAYGASRQGWLAGVYGLDVSVSDLTLAVRPGHGLLVGGVFSGIGHTTEGGLCI